MSTETTVADPRNIDDQLTGLDMLNFLSNLPTSYMDLWETNFITHLQPSREKGRVHNAPWVNHIAFLEQDSIDGDGQTRTVIADATLRGVLDHYEESLKRISVHLEVFLSTPGFTYDHPDVPDNITVRKSQPEEDVIHYELQTRNLREAFETLDTMMHLIQDHITIPDEDGDDE